MNENREILLSVKNMDVCFGKRRNRFKAVDNVSFDIYKGETFGLVGESGSGKTTIGRAIIRINPTTAGDVIFKGQKINGKIPKELDRQVTRQIQMIFQDPMASLNERAKVDYIVSEGLYSGGKLNENERKKKEYISQQTVEVADKVVDKQMRIVQEIASLLGETAAETKIALAKLKESITNE